MISDHGKLNGVSSACNGSNWLNIVVVMKKMRLLTNGSRFIKIGVVSTLS